jgi:hypothetical protein
MLPTRVCSLRDGKLVRRIGVQNFRGLQKPILWQAQLMIELNMDTALAAVNDLHASTGNRVFTLIEIAEAIDGQRVTPPPGMRVTTDEDGNPHPELNPPFPAWVRTLNNILLRLGEEGKLPVEPIAMVAFPPLPPE